MTRARLFVMIALLMLIIPAAFARYSGSGTFDLSWNTIDGGGETFSTGGGPGGFELGGTIGQPDAGTPMIGGSFELVGGFWPGSSPTPDTCLPDIAPLPNGDRLVNVDDLLAVISAWGACPAPPPAGCPADVSPSGGNGVVNVDDLLEVISAWGLCSP